jgi:hypothetical protein
VAFANNAAVDLITWAPTAAQVGTGVLAGTGGDLTGGVETAIVVANNGNVTLSSTTSGPLSDGAGDTINYATITTTASANTTGTVLAAPALANASTTSVTLTAVGKIVHRMLGGRTPARTPAPPGRLYGGITTAAGALLHRFGANVGRLSTGAPAPRNATCDAPRGLAPPGLKPRRAAAALAIGCSTRSRWR